ncbi:hypothetical protein [Acetobacterium wieringae]|nr:hypothetical protein [Acetobacterium wieringae]
MARENLTIQPRTEVWRYLTDNHTHYHMGYNLLPQPIRVKINLAGPEGAGDGVLELELLNLDLFNSLTSRRKLIY